MRAMSACSAAPAAVLSAARKPPLRAVRPSLAALRAGHTCRTAKVGAFNKNDPSTWYGGGSELDPVFMLDADEPVQTLSTEEFEKLVSGVRRWAAALRGRGSLPAAPLLGATCPGRVRRLACPACYRLHSVSVFRRTIQKRRTRPRLPAWHRRS